MQAEAAIASIAEIVHSTDVNAVQRMRSIFSITALYVDVLYGSLLGLAEQDVLFGSPPGLAEQAVAPPTTPEPEDPQDAVESAEPALHAGASSSSSGAMVQPVTKARPLM